MRNRPPAGVDAVTISTPNGRLFPITRATGRVATGPGALSRAGSHGERGGLWP